MISALEKQHHTHCARGYGSLNIPCVGGEMSRACTILATSSKVKSRSWPSSHLSSTVLQKIDKSSERTSTRLYSKNDGRRQVDVQK